MEPAARLEVEPGVDPARHGRSGPQPQRLLDRPEGLPIGDGLGEDEPSRIEAKLAQSLRVGPAEIGKAAARQDEEAGPLRFAERAAEQRRDEAEGGRHVAELGRGELVQGTGDEPALGQMIVDRGDAEGERRLVRALSFQHRKKLPQTGDELASAESACLDPALLEAPLVGSSVTLYGEAHAAAPSGEPPT